LFRADYFGGVLTAGTIEKGNHIAQPEPECAHKIASLSGVERDQMVRL
jgi:hypothetical protein